MDHQPRKGGILKGNKGSAMNNQLSMNGDACSISSMHSISTQASVYAPMFNPGTKPTSDWYNDAINDSDTPVSERHRELRLMNQGNTKPLARIVEGRSHLPNQATNLAPNNDSSLATTPSPPVLLDTNLAPGFANLNPSLSFNSSNSSGTLPRYGSSHANKPSNEDSQGYFSDASSTNSTVRTRLKPRLYSSTLSTTHGRASHSIAEETPKSQLSPAVFVNLPFKERNFNFDFENTSLTSAMGVQEFEEVYGRPPAAPIASVPTSRPAHLNDRYHQYTGTRALHSIGEQPSPAPTSISTSAASHSIDYALKLRRASSTSELGASQDENNSQYMSSKTRSVRDSSISSSSMISPLEASQGNKETNLKVSTQQSIEQSIDLSYGEETSSEIGGERAGQSFEKAIKVGKGTFLLCIPKGICIPEGNMKSNICPSSIEEYDFSNVKDWVKSLWADAYQPTSFDAFLCHVQQAQLLRQLISHGNCPHIFFHGLSSYGKKSLIMALLHEIFGPTSWKVSQEKKEFKNKGEKKVSIQVVASKFHVELDSEDLEENARDILVGLFKEITESMESSRIIDTEADYETNFRAIVLYGVDKLSSDTQQLIRWLMDRYGDTCKLLLCSENANNVLDSVKSRCQPLGVDPPSQQEMVTVLQHIAGKERMRVSLQFITRIVNESNQNLRHAIESLEACKRSLQGQAVREDRPIPTGWEDVVAELAKDILMEQTPKRMYAARNKLQSLLKMYVPPQLILQSLVIELLKNLNFHLQKEIRYWHGLYEKRLSSTSSAVDKLEEFVAKIMSIYKKYKKAALSEAK